VLAYNSARALFHEIHRRVDNGKLWNTSEACVRLDDRTDVNLADK
jgi:hypothetical protein